MRKLVAVLTLLAAAACSRPSSLDRDSALEAAQRALRRGAIEDALAEIDKASTAKTPAPDDYQAYAARLARAEILLAKPDVAQATRWLGDAVPATPRFAALRARQAYLTARVQVAEGQLPQALATLADVPRLAPDAHDVQLDADVLGGQILMRLRRFDEAEQKLGHVMTEAAARHDRYRQMLALNNLGMGLLIRNRFDEALDSFEQVLAFTDLEDTSIYAAALNNAGACLSRLGEFDRAVAVQQQAVRLHQSRGATRLYEQALGELGSTFLLQDDVARGVPNLTKALDIARGAGLQTDAALWAKNLAAAYVFTGQWDAAERYNEEAIRLTPPEAQAKTVFNELHAARIAAGRHQVAEAKRLFTEALHAADNEPSVQWAAHEGLARLAVEEGRRDRAAAHFETALAAIEHTRSDLLETDYKLSFLTQLIRFYRAYVDTLVDDGKIDRALEVADSSRGRVLADRHGTSTPARVQADAIRVLARRADVTLVSYWLAPKRSYMWVVDGHAIRMYPLPGEDDVRTLVEQHQASVRDALGDPLRTGESAGDRLYQLLIAPFAATLPREARVIIVPDGALYGLNFETLPVSRGTRHYWIEDVRLQVAPSLALLSTGPHGPSTSPSILLIGNANAHRPNFPALKYAAVEMQNVAGHFPASRRVLVERDAASPDAYRNAHPDSFSIIHFTAHATTNLDSPLDSAVILSGAEHGYKLYARDVASLPLHADLVTISACRSAGEKTYSGEGLIGFAWAFLRAGARRVVAGLWDVDDRSTAELMDALYSRIAAGEGADAALRDAKLALIAHGGSFAKPYYWAPFELFTVAP